MATAVSSSSAYKILIPVNRCNHFIAGCQGGSLSDYIRQVCEEVGRQDLKAMRWFEWKDKFIHF